MKRKTILCGIIALGMFGLVGCSNNTTNTASENKGSGTVVEEEVVDAVQEECLSNLKKGLQAYFDATNKKSDTIDESISHIRKGLNKEWRYISQYEDYEFEDTYFTEMVSGYIKAVKNQRTGIKYKFTNNRKYQKKYNKNGLDAGSEYLMQLSDAYDLEVTEEYESNFESLLNPDHLKTIDIGDAVTIDTEQGSVNISIGEITSSDWNNRIKKALGYEDDGTITGILECTIENISYNNIPFSIENFIRVENMQGLTQNTCSTGYEWKDCVVATGGWMQTALGAKEKIACPYILNRGTEMVHIVIDDTYEIYLHMQ